MPVILVKDYTWRQTSEEIIISVPIIGKPNNVDVLAIGNYLKASYPPFILELFLHEEIIEEDSSCVISDELAIFTLKKKEIGREWPILILENLSREMKQEYRIEAMKKAQVTAEIRDKKRSEKRQQLQQKAVKEQIEWDSRVYNKIEELRDSHRKEAMREFDDWRQKAELPMLESETKVLQENRKKYRDPIEWFKDSPTSALKLNEIIPANAENKIQDEEIISVKNTDQSAVSAENHEKLNYKNEEDARRGKKIIDNILMEKYRGCDKTIFEENNTSTPIPRKCGKINIKFSERVFPTPARESHYLEEQEWLEKQAEARRKCGFASENLSEDEQNPQWLKDKGDEFFKIGNYLAAVSAYTHGIKLSEKMSSLYANRAAAQYALGNYQRCAEDCSKALGLMVPKCEGNRESRARCHARLGAALCKLSAPQHGIQEFKEALKLAPDNNTIKRDMEEAKNYFNLNNSDE